MSAIIKAANFGAIPSLHIGVKESRQRSRAFWGPDVEEGDYISDYQSFQKAAADRLVQAIESDPRAAVMIPLVDLYDTRMLKAAVWDDSYGFEGFRKDIKKAQQDLVSELDSQLSSSTMKKATSTATVSNLMHNYSDEQVVMLFKKIYPFQALIGVEANHGKIAQWDAITKNGAGTAYFGSENPPSLQASDLTDAIRTAICKIMYAPVQVTKMVRVAGQTQFPARDIMSIRTLAANEMIRNLRERSMIGVTRDVTIIDTAFETAPTLAYPGIYELMTNNTAAPMYKAYSGGAATLDKIKPYIDETIRLMVLNGQTPNLGVCDWKTFQVIGRGLNDFWRTEQVKSTSFGVGKVNIVTPVGEVPLIPIQFMPVATGTIQFMDTSYLARRVLWGDTFEELANVNTVYNGVIDAAEVLIDKTDATGTDSLIGGVTGITLPVVA